MKFKILPITACLFCSAIQAQERIFHLKEYRFRTPRYRSLDFRLDLNGAIQNNQGTHRTSRYFQLMPSHLNYTAYHSTDRRLRSSSLQLSPSFSANTEIVNGAKYQYDFSQIHFNWSLDERYYRNNQWFFQFANELSNDYNRAGNKDSVNKLKSRELLLHDQLRIGFGKGRIELVQDAQLALFIVNELAQQGLFDKVPDAATINELAQLITRLNYLRVFDFRRRRIFELTQLDSFFRNKGLITDTDIRHFTTINDNWTFAFNPLRRSGHNWFIQLQLTGGLENDKQTNTKAAPSVNEMQRYTYGAGPRLGYENYKPRNLQWQRNAGIYLSWLFENHDKHSRLVSGSTTTETDENLKQDRAQLFAFYGWSFIPNTRTIFSAEISLDTYRTSVDDNTILRNVSSLRPAVQLSANYFLGYRTRLYGAVSFSHHSVWTRTDLAKTYESLLHSGLTLSLYHSIF